MAKPVVDGLERDLEGRARLFRVDRATPLAGELGRRYGVRLLPAILIFDGEGNLVQLQEGSVDRDGARELLDKIFAAGGNPFSCGVPLEDGHTPFCAEP